VENGVSFNSGIGTFNLGGLSGTANQTLLDTGTNPVTLSVGANNADTTYSGILSGAGAAVTKVGNGTLTLSGAQDYAALLASAGTTNLNAALGTGTSTVTANANVNIGVSQTLASLAIGAGATVVLGASPAPVEGAALGAGFGGDAGALTISDPSAPAVEAVPEPGALGLLAAGALGMLARRRRVAS
jgi:hypothetical protein